MLESAATRRQFRGIFSQMVGGNLFSFNMGSFKVQPTPFPAVLGKTVAKEDIHEGNQSRDAAPSPRSPKRRAWLIPVIVAAIVVVLAGAGVGAFLGFQRRRRRSGRDRRYDCKHHYVRGR